MTPPLELQEQLLVALAYHDRDGEIVEAIVSADLFDLGQREVADRLIKYRRKHKRAPAEALYSLFSDLPEAELEDVRPMLGHLAENKDRVAFDHVLDRAQLFVRRQRLRRSVVAAMEILQTDESEDGLAEIDRLFRSVQESDRTPSTELVLSNFHECWPVSGLEDLEDTVRTGIRQIDDYHLGPRRRQLHLFVGSAKSGKSWWGVHLAKMAAGQRKNVLYVTLEISQEDIARRIYQSQFQIQRVRSGRHRTRMETDKKGKVVRRYREEVPDPFCETDAGFYEELERRVTHQATNRFLGQIRVKEFPTGQLSVRELRAYLDSLAANGFRPDLVIVDYADLMEVSADNYRQSLERLFVNLRGLAVEGNFALATMSQSNRKAVSSRIVGAEHVAEAWGKIAVADTVFTLSRTEVESGLHLVRLRVAASRVGQDGLAVFLTQDYPRGQFVVDSAWASEKSEEVLRGVEN